MFFQGEAQSMRLASTYSLQQGARGMPMILEFQVIPGENDQGVRLVVNEQWYTGPRGAGMFCLGMGRDPVTGLPGPIFVPIQIGGNSFVLVRQAGVLPLQLSRFPLQAPAVLGGSLGHANASRRHPYRAGAAGARPRPLAAGHADHPSSL